MTAPLSPAQHYLAAEADLATAYVVDREWADYHLRNAQVHALLAAVPWSTYAEAGDIADRARAADQAMRDTEEVAQ